MSPQLSRNTSIHGRKKMETSILDIPKDFGDGQKSNPVVQRVKLIMSFGLLLVHVHRYVQVCWAIAQTDTSNQHKTTI